MGMREGMPKCSPVLLEPIMKVTVTTPDEFMGDIMGDLNSRRGRVLGMDSAGKYQVINAEVPLSEFQTYAPDLTSMTGGRGISPADSAGGLIERIEQLDMSNTGSFWHAEGYALPW